MSGELATTATTIARRDELTIEDMLAQVQKVQQVMARVMKDGEHYGVIPGTKKPTLLKPGAEKLCLLFRLDPQYSDPPRVEKDGPHVTIQSTCTLFHIPSGERWGSGQGSCSTKESKYAWRQGSRTCPKCGKEDTIIKGRKEYGGGWLCFGKKGGCGEKFPDGDQSIEGQNTERVPNPDLADAYNTILKMANKRALVAAVLNVTAASDIFTQDLEDIRPPAPAEPVIIEGEVVRTPAARASDSPPPPPGGPEKPSYEPFGAITMCAKMTGSVDALPDYFGPGITTKTRLDKMRADDDTLFRAGYDKLHAAYLAWKDQQP